MCVYLLAGGFDCLSSSIAYNGVKIIGKFVRC